MSRKDFLALLRFGLRVALLFWQIAAASVVVAALMVAPIALIQWICSRMAGV